MPNDLCHASAWSFASPFGRSSARSAMNHCVMMRITTIQCSALDNVPHERVVLRKVMPVSYPGKARRTT